MANAATAVERAPEKFIAAAVQIDIRLGDPAKNLSVMNLWARKASAQGARLVIFPECALTGYCFESVEEARLLAETIPGPSTTTMGALARELGVYLVYGLVERDGERVFNALAFVGPEGPIGNGYRKVHLPYLGLDRFATPGDRPFCVEETPLCRIGLHICYDAGFPESARVLTLQGADLIVLPTNWPPGSEEFAVHGIPTRALENNVYAIAANRVGEERGFRFVGRSSICSPRGKVLAFGDSEVEQLLLAEIDPACSREKRIVRVPGKHVIDRIRDRRPEFYGLIGSPKMV